MNNITMLVDQAMAQWQEETDCGATDPAFGGEIGEDIDKLVDGLSVFEVKTLLKTEKPIVFVEGTGVTYDSLEEGVEVTFTIKNERFKFKKGEQVLEMSKEEAYDMANVIIDIIE